MTAKIFQDHYPNPLFDSCSLCRESDSIRLFAMHATRYTYTRARNEGRAWATSLAQTRSQRKIGSRDFHDECYVADAP